MIMSTRSPTSDAKFSSRSSQPRWADIGSDDETDYSEPDSFGLAPVLEDSYRCKPDPALEDSNHGVNEQLRSLATLKSGTDDDIKENEDPKDFGFLLKTPRGRGSCNKSPLGANLQVETTPRSALTPLSAGAPEFIPTPCGDAIFRSTSAPLVGESALLTPLSTPPACSRTSSGSLLLSKKKRSGISGMKKPLRKRGRAAVQKARSVSEFSEDSASVVSQSCSNFSLEPFEMPEMTEEEWKQREARRMRDIKVGKESPEYLRFCELIPEDARREPGMPTTPRASDPMISKRRWKESIQKWRLELARQFGTQQQQNIACESVRSCEALVV